MKRIALFLAGIGIGVVGVYVLVSKVRPQPNHGVRGSERGGLITEGQPATQRGSRRPSGVGPGTAAPPRFESRVRSVLQSNPRQPGYDAVKLTELGHPPNKVFQAEPRDDAWAKPMEKILVERLSADLQAFTERAKVASVECRSSSCLLQVDAPEDDKERLILGLQMPPLGDIMAPESANEVVQPGWQRQAVYVLFAAENREVQTHTALQQKRREMGLRVLTGMGSELTRLGVDPSKLPPLTPAANR